MAATELKNPDFELAVNFVCRTNKPVFLTGKAGTGKTTFLKYIRDHCPKKMAVVAPTGVAAINAGGVTMHSLFQLPLGTYIADFRSTWGGTSNTELTNRHTLLKNLRLNRNKKQLLQELQLLIIDEVSMLRADMLDAIDTILRHVRQQTSLPFGGIQVLFIGDLYQLPPVVSREEWQLMSAYYQSPFFFDAHVLAEHSPVYLELNRIYRQSDSGFIRLLNHIRNNETDAKDMSLLESRYNPAFEPDVQQRYIMLTSHNAKADLVNRSELERLDGRTCTFEGLTKGDFGDKNTPVDKLLQLKTGAQVMFVKNDKGEQRRYYNGKIATVSRIEGDNLWVIPEDGQELKLEKETWRNINYKYSPEKDEVEEEELGSFTQYPLKLAWAITIHKSQGLTFERAIIDAGASFAAGQVYVALSRLTGLEGLVLHTRIQAAQVQTDERIIAFSNRQRQVGHSDQLLQAAQREFAGQTLLDCFDLNALSESLLEANQLCHQSAIPDKETALSVCRHLSEQATELTHVAARFRHQLQQLLLNPGQAVLHERSQAAVTYFGEHLAAMYTELRHHLAAWLLKPRSKKYTEQLQLAALSLQRQQFRIAQAGFLAEGMRQGLDTGILLEQLAERQMKAETIEAAAPVAKKEKGSSQRTSLQMYKEGLSMAEIAAQRSMAQSTVESHLCSFIASGEIEIGAFVSNEELSRVLSAIRRSDTASATAIRELTGPELSFTQIRAVQAYYKRLQEAG